MNKVTRAALQLRLQRKGYIHTREHMEELARRGLAEWLPIALGHEGMSGVSPADAVELYEAARKRTVLEYIWEFATLCGNDLTGVDFEFVRTDTPNAFAAYHPDDNSYAIGFDHGLWSMFGTLFIAAGVACDYDKFDLLLGVAQRLTLTFFGNVALPPSEAEEVILAMYSRTPPLIKKLSELAGPMCVRFLIGHEVGHIELGHLTGGHAKRYRFAVGGPEIPVSAVEWQSEFEADSWAAEAILKLAGDDLMAKTLAVTTPVVFCELIALVERLYQPSSDLGQLLRASHPPTTQRADRLRRWASQYTNIPPTDAMTYLVKVANYARRELE